MNTIRKVAASVVLAFGLAGSSYAAGLGAPLPYSVQTDAGLPDTTTKAQQDEAIRLISAHLGLWLSADASRYGYEQILTEDAVFEYPFAEESQARHVEGRSAVAAAVRALAHEATDWSFSDLKLIQTPHPDVFFVTYKAKAYVPATGRVYDQVLIARMTVKDGKIANYYELWNRQAKAIAFGTALPKKSS